MEALLVHPKDETQLAAIKAFMKALDIHFEKQEHLSEYVLNEVQQSRLEESEGKVVPFTEVRDMLR